MENELFEKMPIPKAYMKMAIPVVMGMVITLVYNMVDTYFVAGTGNLNLIAGVAIGSPVFTLMIALGDIFGLGGSSLISRLFGQQRYEDGKRMSVFCFYASILLGIVVSIILLTGRRPILLMLGATEETYQYASQYYTFIALGAPALIMPLTPNNILRTEGFAVPSMIGSIIGSVVNIILDPIMIYAMGLGAAGAAIATVIGNLFTCAFYSWFLARKSKMLSIDPRGLFVTKEEIKDILAIGVPASITNLMQSLGIVLMNRALLPYGNDRIAIMGVVMKINMIAVLVMVGFAFGGQPLTGYSYGAKNRKRLKETLTFAFVFQSLLAAVLTLILMVGARLWIGLFLEDALIIQTGMTMLRIQQSSMICVGIVLVSTCMFQSGGKAFEAFLLSVSRQGIIFAIVLFLLSRIFGYTGVLVSQPVSDLLTALLAAVLFAGWWRRDVASWGERK